jgi:hypothetical protein
MGTNLMKSMAGYLALPLGFCLVGPAVADNADVAGVYELVNVNGEPLPTEAWNFEDFAGDCKNLTERVTLLLDSYGRWAALSIGRTECPAGEDREASESREAAIFGGSWTHSDNMISLHEESLEGNYHGYINGQSLELTIEGDGMTKNQTSEFRFQALD